jgi:hypothetical protein
MKRFLMLFAVAATLAACNTEKKADAPTAPATVTLPYTPSYSASFEIGNPEYAKTILQGSWKDWEDNNLDNMRNWVADSVMAYHSDNSVVMGLDSLMARWKRGRATYSATKPTIDAVIPVYSTDQKENWVLVWATEITTKPDGSSDTTSIMETWRINKEGKADILYQFDRAKRKK